MLGEPDCHEDRVEVVEIKVGDGATEEEALGLKVLVRDGVFVSNGGGGGGIAAEPKGGFESEDELDV
ncbi:hypothetical protein GH714_009014 [Hevea brasiliensis]|uniref:Uncharacterized protein n=1 Tax=Hevea brasiliensis TaxID=3981 RepID=A0A6A6NC67_HEVBR|nr:hypothetical protein GH714_009014 [Hevea brasiliensis]